MSTGTKVNAEYTDKDGSIFMAWTRREVNFLEREGQHRIEIFLIDTDRVCYLNNNQFI